MKASFGMILCLLLALSGCRSEPDVAKSPDPANRDVQELMREARAALPKNWAVTYDSEYRALQIERNQPLLTYGATIINGPVEDKPVSPASSKPLMGFRVLPYLTPAAWQAKHADSHRRMIAIEKKVSPRRGKEVMSPELYAHTEAEKPLVEEYNRALEEQSALPQYHYQDIGLSLYWDDGSLAPFEGLVNETEREACLQVYRRFLKLLRKYEPLAEGQPPDDSA